MFDRFFIEIIKVGLQNYDIYTLGSRAAEWYERGLISQSAFEEIQGILVPTGGSGEQE
jgi:hypothetical protein